MVAGSAQKKNAQRRREAAQRRTLLRLAQLGIKYDLSGGPVQVSGGWGMAGRGGRLMVPPAVNATYRVFTIK